MLDINSATYSFGDLQLDTRKRLLLRAGKPVQLTAKAFELLLVLLENDGREISKIELMKRLWPNQIVEDANLTVTMSQVRKALGEKAGEHRFIVTIPGRGYCFVSEVRRNDALIVDQHSVSEIRIEQESEHVEAPITTAATGKLLQGNSNAAVEGATVLAKRPHSKPSKSRFKPGHLLIIGLSIVLVLLAFWWTLSRFRPRSDVATTAFSEATIKQLTTKGKVRWVALSPDGNFFAYVLTERDARKESLWLGQTDATNEIQLRPPAGEYEGLAFSPDSKTLYFALTDELQSGFFKIPVLGGVSEKLSNIQTSFSLSPDGRQIAFLRSNKAQNATTLVIANLDGSGERELLTRTPDNNFSVNCLAWSPDLSHLAFAAVNDGVKQSREISILNLGDGSVEQLTQSEWARISNLLWLPNNRGLMLVGTNKTETLRNLWRVDTPGGSPHRISHDIASYGAALSISADGQSLLAVQLKRESNIWIAPTNDLFKARQITFSSLSGIYGWDGLDWKPDGDIVFTAGVDRNVAIYSINSDGNNIKQITSGGYFDQKPKVTRDGRFIVFQSNRSGGNEIWRVQPDGNGLLQLTAGGQNISPHLTPDGRWVVYVRTRNGDSFVWRVPIEGGEPVQVTDKESSDPAVSPDGRLIACAYKPDDNGPLKLALVNFEDGKPVRLLEVPRFASFTDAIRWTPDGKAILYRDREWGLWRQELNGGEPVKLPGLTEAELLRFDWSRDGKLFAFARGRTISDAVLLRDPR